MTRLRTLLPMLLLAVAACSRPSAPPASRAVDTARITGTVLEQVDAPPHTYLRLATGEGEVWVAVPVTAVVAREKPVTVTNGVPLAGLDVKPLGRRVDRIYFGTLEGAR